MYRIFKKGLKEAALNEKLRQPVIDVYDPSVQ